MPCLLEMREKDSKRKMTAAGYLCIGVTFKILKGQEVPSRPLNQNSRQRVCP